ncbi:MAG TPA: DUF4402 domain-containing protein [Sphingomicrobium sp.]|jgi:hypothetical protein
MNKLLRMTSLAATAAALAFAATPAAAAVTSGTDATAKVRILRPLTLVSSANLNLGDIVLSGTGTYSATVKLSSGNVRTCAANVTCSGTTTVAKYDLTGTKGQVVTISAPDVTMTGPGSVTLTLKTTDSGGAAYYPTTVTLDATTGAGTFNIGGEVTVANTTPDGVYTGNFNVTAAYQ